jgi:hypothetical protein
MRFLPSFDKLGFFRSRVFCCLGKIFIQLLISILLRLPFFKLISTIKLLHYSFGLTISNLPFEFVSAVVQKQHQSPNFIKNSMHLPELRWLLVISTQHHPIDLNYCLLMNTAL